MTSWPRARQRPAVASTASTHSGAMSMPAKAARQTPMRSLRGASPTADRRLRARAGAAYGAPLSMPATASMAAAVSRTVRLSTPSTARPPQPSPRSGPIGTTPRDGLSPNRPQQAAGMRMEPPPSLPCAIGTMPAATAAAAPPLEPPAGPSGGAPATRGFGRGAAIARGLGGRCHAQFGHGGPGKGNEAARLETRNQGRILRISRVLEKPRADAGGQAPGRQARILEQERDAAERASRGPVFRARQRLLVAWIGQRVQARRARCRQAYGAFHQLRRADLTVLHQRGQREAIEGFVFVILHRESQGQGAMPRLDRHASVQACAISAPRANHTPGKLRIHAMNSRSSAMRDGLPMTWGCMVIENRPPQR